jgi:UDP-N-acetyl-D-glucosamine dehydrogenase
LPTVAAIIGLGDVGLPLAREAARAGYRVLGLDINEEVVAGLSAGRSHVDDLSDADISSMLDGGFTATTDFSLMSTADVIVICVPTPLSVEGGPDLSAVTSAISSIKTVLRPGVLVILESTTYPGTTDEVVRPMLETSGLRVGADFHLAFSPERIDPGNSLFTPANTPKVVGGCTTACTKAAASFYSTFIDTIVTTKGTREAEMAKLLENTYRHINIALVNEMARFCHDLHIDLWDSIAAASTKPFGYHAFRPGPGVGGHCIPIDPNYLSHNVRSRLGYPFRFVELAQEINAGMPAYIVRRIQDLLNRDSKPLRGARVLLLGVTYKPNIADTRESPAAVLAKMLTHRGADVSYHDPHVKDWSIDEFSPVRVDDLIEATRLADICILLQNHRAYDVDALAQTSQLFFDTRGTVTPGLHVERL